MDFELNGGIGIRHFFKKTRSKFRSGKDRERHYEVAGGYPDLLTGLESDRPPGFLTVRMEPVAERFGRLPLV
jgi:hypothetical protein